MSPQSVQALRVPGGDLTPQFDVLATGYQFVEAPRVDHDGTLYFSDLLGGGFFSRGTDGVVRMVLADRRWIGGAVFDDSQCIIVSGEGGLAKLDPRSGVATALLTELDGRPIVAVNDIEADLQGGLFGGSIDFGAILDRQETPRPGHLFHLAASGDLTLLRDDVVGSNGMDISPDGKYLYHSESTRGVWRYPMSAQGMPGAAQLLVQLDDSDGLVVDSAGRLWVACWQAAKILRFGPDGTFDQAIDLPFPHVVSLCFGGADLMDVYVSTGMSAQQRGGGGIIRFKSDVPGQPTRRSRFLC